MGPTRYCVSYRERDEGQVPTYDASGRMSWGGGDGDTDINIAVNVGSVRGPQSAPLLTFSISVKGTPPPTVREAKNLGVTLDTVHPPI